MRKNPVYILQNCAKVVRSGAFLMYFIHHQTLYAHTLASSSYRHMQYVAYITSNHIFSALVSMCNFEQTGSVILLFN